jgi:hypothetical protein
MDLAKKLQLRPEQYVEVLLSPVSLASSLGPLTAKREGGESPALLVFVVNRNALEVYHSLIVSSALADRLTWVAYPKSGQLGTDLNRDALTTAIAKGGAQPVRQIAIDDVWSALRFRPGK